MDINKFTRRDFLGVGLAAGSSFMISRVAEASDAAPQSKAVSQNVTEQKNEGRLTFHAIDTHHGATIGLLNVDLLYFEDGKYKLLKKFTTVKNGRSDGPVIKAGELKAGLYEATLHFDEYFKSLNVPLPSPNFLTKVPIRFGIATPSQRYHLAILFNPWSYSYYRGS